MMYIHVHVYMCMYYGPISLTVYPSSLLHLLHVNSNYFVHVHFNFVYMYMYMCMYINFSMMIQRYKSII